jgi:hypothetical protein
MHPLLADERLCDSANKTTHFFQWTLLKLSVAGQSYSAAAAHIVSHRVKFMHAPCFIGSGGFPSIETVDTTAQQLPIHSQSCGQLGTH